MPCRALRRESKDKEPDDPGFAPSSVQALPPAPPAPPRTGEVHVSFQPLKEKHTDFGKPVMAGDLVFIDIENSHRKTATYNTRIKAWKKASSALRGGYLMCGDVGQAVSFRVELDSKAEEESKEEVVARIVRRQSVSSWWVRANERMVFCVLCCWELCFSPMLFRYTPCSGSNVANVSRMSPSLPPSRSLFSLADVVFACSNDSSSADLRW